MHGRRLAVIGLFGAWVAGCASPPATKLNYAVTRVEAASQDVAMAAAEQALREHFRIARVDRAAGLIECAPVESQEAVRSGRIGDVLGASRRVRRVAEVRVEDLGDGARVFCKVLLQQYETEERRMFDREHALSDVPSETPAAGEAATLPQQNATWRTRGRDKVLERRILQAVHELVAAPGRPTPGAS